MAAIGFIYAWQNLYPVNSFQISGFLTFSQPIIQLSLYMCHSYFTLTKEQHFPGGLFKSRIVPSTQKQSQCCITEAQSGERGVVVLKYAQDTVSGKVSELFVKQLPFFVLFRNCLNWRHTSLKNTLKFTICYIFLFSCTP